MSEIKEIVTKFAESGWDVIDAPSRAWLANPNGTTKVQLINAIKSADEACGSCGCEFDALYKSALELLGA